MERILTYFQESLGVSDKELIDAVTSTAYVSHYEKGSFLLRQGELPEGLCFLLNGVLRGYCLDKDGTDITVCFGYRFGTVVMPYADMKQPSPVNIEALEPCDIFIIPRQTIQNLIVSNFEAVSVCNQMLLAGVAEHWEIKIALYQYSGAQKYAWFSQKYEGLIDRIPHKYIASFLGMSPVTLSRLRGQQKKHISLAD